MKNASVKIILSSFVILLFLFGCSQNIETSVEKNMSAESIEKDIGLPSNMKVIDSIGNVGKYTSIASYMDNVFISYYDETNKNLKVAISANRGIGWTTKTLDYTGVVGRFASIVVNGHNIYIAYLEDLYGGTYGRIKLATSNDNGSTWVKQSLIDMNSEDVSGISIDVSGASIFIAYYNKYYVDRDIYNIKLARSNDNGKTWKFTPISSSSNFINQFGEDNDYMTDVRYDNNRIYVGYFEEGITGPSQMKLVRSDDNGLTWNKTTVGVSDMNCQATFYVNNNKAVFPCNMNNWFYSFASFDYGNTWNWIVSGDIGVLPSYPSIQGSGNNLYISFNSVGRLFFSRSTDFGNTWKDYELDDGAGYYSSLSKCGDFIYISYYDRTNGDLKFIKSGNDGVSWTPFNFTPF